MGECLQDTADADAGGVPEADGVDKLSGLEARKNKVLQIVEYGDHVFPVGKVFGLLTVYAAVLLVGMQYAVN